jgi:beta-glucosidase
MSVIDNDYRRIILPGIYDVSVGGKQPGFHGIADAATTDTVAGRFEISGQIEFLDEH